MPGWDDKLHDLGLASMEGDGGLEITTAILLFVSKEEENQKESPISYLDMPSWKMFKSS